MSLKRLAVISAVGSHNSFNNQTISYVSSYSGAGGSGSTVEQGVAGSGGSTSSSGSSSNHRTGGHHHHQGLQTMRPGANLHGNVNIMLGGAMLSVVITVVCFVCYCCHRNIKKRSNSIYRQQWLETEANMEIYSVEQCYDPPPSGGASGFFMDSGSTGGTVDYQPLPVVTSAINHTGHLQFPYQHHPHYQHLHHQQYHYAAYPNGPPPSYDTVVAQDELLASAASRRKRSCPEAVGGTAQPQADGSTASSCGGSCGALHPESEDCKLTGSCTATLLQKAAARARYSGGGRLQAHRRGLTRGGSDNGSNDPEVTEPFWRSVELEEAEWHDEQKNASVRVGDGWEASCSCTVTAVTDGRSNGSQEPPIYCRNCGYYVEGRRYAPSIDLTEAMSAERPLEWRVRSTNNEPLLVDYDSATAPPSPRDSRRIDRNDVIDDSSNMAVVVGSGNNTPDIDMPTTRMTSTSASTTERLDAMNNNNATNETDGSIAFRQALRQLPPAEAPQRIAAVPAVHNENNNVITGPSTGMRSGPFEGGEPRWEDANLIEMHENRPPAGGSDVCTEEDDIFQWCEGGSDVHAAPIGIGPNGPNRRFLQPTPEETATVADQANGNSGATEQILEDNAVHPGSLSFTLTDRSPVEAGRPEPGIRRLLSENGLVRLDMSRIIDNTGLPTYEAALKLESSGYV